MHSLLIKQHSHRRVGEYLFGVVFVVTVVVVVVATAIVVIHSYVRIVHQRRHSNSAFDRQRAPFYHDTLYNIYWLYEACRVGHLFTSQRNKVDRIAG